MKAYNTNSNFKNTKFSYNSNKKHALSNIDDTNVKDTLSVFSFNNNNCEKIRDSIIIKLGKKEEYEFPSKKILQKELIQKVFTKESGEIINLIKKVNNEMKAPTHPEKTKSSYLRFSIHRYFFI